MEGMKPDYSVARLLEYCDELGSSGQRNKNTASAMRTACERLLVDLSPDEMDDVRRVDVEAVATKYTNKKIAKPKTCLEYRRRVTTAIAEFKEHMESMETGKASCPVSPIPEIDKSTVAEIEKPVRAKPVRIPREAPSTTAMTLEIPVRSDFKAQLVLPYDLTPSEAKRLCKLIEALPISEG
ncbi:MAG TPA: hypothetical protein PLX54_10240 [Candidatus Fermentibacter daniensis]|nr:hypothetical protein [Candidatus Fermentibacter daniensis]HPK52725.1 hypothetical protein [Candidatus Fermentibacter daniensis]